MRRGGVPGEGAVAGGNHHRALHYVALETEQSLFDRNCAALRDAGYTEEGDASARGQMATFTLRARAAGAGAGAAEGTGEGGKGGGAAVVTVSLVQKDFSSLQPRTLGAIHLFVAACFADLMPPAAFVRTLLRLSGGLSASTLVYAPITFAGQTLMHPR